MGIKAEDKKVVEDIRKKTSAGEIGGGYNHASDIHLKKDGPAYSALSDEDKAVVNNKIDEIRKDLIKKGDPLYKPGGAMMDKATIEATVYHIREALAPNVEKLKAEAAAKATPAPAPEKESPQR